MWMFLLDPQIDKISTLFFLCEAESASLVQISQSKSIENKARSWSSRSCSTLSKGELVLFTAINDVLNLWCSYFREIWYCNLFIIYVYKYIYMCCVSTCMYIYLSNFLLSTLVTIIYQNNLLYFSFINKCRSLYYDLWFHF